ncbi:biotin-dependent carboxyltransferase family protein [Marinovum sp.]|uniref:5-oxoprolinase subunit C family protein n=1 Tax=Marinovum sp. TaxID=2024839 RepID=UPI002B26C3E5|nr:biotin-dependent carboxyltransferase family protein [Marinovum sp.]
MSRARLTVRFAGPLVTYQDGGRVGQMRFGVAASGPMDRLSAQAANVALGNAPGATLIEISMGGLMLDCTEGALSVAVTGGDFAVTCGGTTHGSWTILALEAGETLAIRPGKRGSWAYLALAGRVEADSWLGSVATHSTSGFGGGALSSGQQIVVEEAGLRPERHGAIARPEFLPDDRRMRVVLGPQDRHFAPEALAAFRSEPYALTNAFDRMGLRLEGPELPLAGALSIPSEPITRGAVQVAGDGVPTVLLADHQTTGGYPKIATVIADDIARLSQLRAGDRIRFAPVSPVDAVQIARQTARARAAYLQAIAKPKGTLLQRLMRANLISGAVTGGEGGPGAAGEPLG